MPISFRLAFKAKGDPGLHLHASGAPPFSEEPPFNESASKAARLLLQEHLLGKTEPAAGAGAAAQQQRILSRGDPVAGSGRHPGPPAGEGSSGSKAQLRLAWRSPDITNTKMLRRPLRKQTKHTRQGPRPRVSKAKAAFQPRAALKREPRSVQTRDGAPPT